MTPKEKAKELVKRYADFNSSMLQMMSGKYSNGIAKQCALIAVDEILNMYFSNHLEEDYWKDVKVEIVLL
jgi:hypothetical protein